MNTINLNATIKTKDHDGYKAIEVEEPMWHLSSWQGDVVHCMTPEGPSTDFCWYIILTNWFTGTEVRNFLVEVEEKTVEVMYVALGQTKKENVWLNLDQVGDERSIAILMTSEEAHDACKSFLRKNIEGKAIIMKMIATAKTEYVPQTIFTEVN
ncbi:hypothetical protein VIPECLOM01_00239 [Enterobacter phage vB_VIPECLOM01]|nr:hypothetical protein VIPECLOM01_00239 [Enterobacter phage vB_VIPECLOM01]